MGNPNTNQRIVANQIKENAITEVKIVDGAVSTSKLQNLSVTSPKIDNLAVVTEKIADYAIQHNKLHYNTKITYSSINPDYTNEPIIKFDTNKISIYDKYTNGTEKISFSDTGGITATTFTGALSGNASTATILQNARTINGTSFNGSANITTTNWGIARTISIGGTGKSVNGSGNITWAESEIAANTAVTLKTARTIAGTSFNGSANIAISYANLTNKPSFYTSHTYAISGDINVPSGETDYVVPFYVPVSSGTTVKLISARHSVYSGSCTVKLTRNGSDISGFTSLSVSTTDTTTNPSDVTLSDMDEIALVVTASSSAKHLTFSLVLEVTL